MTYFITESCIDNKDKACITECPVDCIYEGDRMVYINPEECIECGACEPVCPTNAIYFSQYAPEDKVVFIEINKQFFDNIGNPGGASLIDTSNSDHPKIKEYKK